MSLPKRDFDRPGAPGRLPYDSIKVTSTRKDFWHRYVTSPRAADLILEDVILRGILQ